MRIDKGLAAIAAGVGGRGRGARQFGLFGEHRVVDRQLVDDLEFELVLVIARQRHQFVDAGFIGAAVDAFARFAGHDDELRAGAVDADAQLFHREGIELAARRVGVDRHAGVDPEQVDAQVGARHQRGNGGIMRGAAARRHIVGNAHAGQGAQGAGELLALAFERRVGGGEEDAEIAIFGIGAGIGPGIAPAPQRPGLPAPGRSAVPSNSPSCARRYSTGVAHSVAKPASVGSAS